MDKNKVKFADDLENQTNKVIENEKNTPNTNDLEDKWNQIQDDYMTQHKDLDMDDLYFEGGGFNGIITKISEQTGKTVEAVKKEIEKW